MRFHRAEFHVKPVRRILNSSDFGARNNKRSLVFKNHVSALTDLLVLNVTLALN